MIYFESLYTYSHQKGNGSRLNPLPNPLDRHVKLGTAMSKFSQPQMQGDTMH